MKKIPILIISFILCLIFAPIVLASEVTGNMGNSGFLSGMDGGVPNDPVASPASGHSASSAFTVSLTATNATTILYTVNGSTPSCPATGTVYNAAITISASKTVKAIACYDTDSSVPSNSKTFTYTISSGSGGGSGGGGSTTYCSTVTYSAWGTTCVGNLQYRTVLTQVPSGCTLTTAQQLAAQRTCQVATSTPSGTEDETPAEGTGASTSTPSGTTGGGDTVLQSIMTEAQIVDTDNRGTLLTHLGGTEANTTSEQNGLTKYAPILGLDKTITAVEKMTIDYFIVYGTLSTQRLGAGERAAVINSYYKAYGRLPNSEAEWSDVLKIANGRWPSERNAATEAGAKAEFKKVYARNANMSNNIDENAIMVIAYGLLPLQRNLNSEKTAIITFKWVYGHNPVNALAWNIVRAIAYSGAKR